MFSADADTTTATNTAEELPYEKLPVSKMFVQQARINGSKEFHEIHDV
jgi:hypothetical protein